MKNKTHVLFVLLFLNSTFLFAKDSVGDCSNPLQEKELNTSNVPMSELVIDGKSEFVFCYDLKADPRRTEMNEEFKMLDVLGVFDDKGCVNDKKPSAEVDQMLKKFIAKNVNENVNLYASVDPKTNRARVIYTNASNDKYVNSALTTKDKWQIAGFSATSIAVGAFMSEKLYAGQADKRKHWKVGATISGLTTGATYFLLEEAGLGDKLGLTKTQKKVLIMLSGPLMGTIAGIYKEYKDTKDRANHTPDINDAIATSLGAGGAIFSVAFAF